MINQLDLRAGIKGLSFCNDSGSRKLAKAFKNKAVGAVTTPMKKSLIKFSIIKCISVKLQDKKINAS